VAENVTLRPSREVRLQYRVEVASHPGRRQSFPVAGPRHQRSADHRLDGPGEAARVDGRSQCPIGDGRAKKRFDLTTRCARVRQQMCAKRFLRERASFLFRGDAASRVVERTATLTALDRRIVFNDNKEGLFGMRVARQLEQPSTTPEVFTDANGRATSVPVLDNAGVTGSYTSSEGKTGDAVWSTRGRWTMLTGKIGSEAVTLAILDHKSNPGFPTYWHARGYGLFAANPLGQKVFDAKQPALNVTLEPGASMTFRYRFLILDGTATAARLEREFTAFADGR